MKKLALDEKHSPRQMFVESAEVPEPILPPALAMVLFYFLFLFNSKFMCAHLFKQYISKYSKKKKKNPHLHYCTFKADLRRSPYRNTHS